MNTNKKTLKSYIKVPHVFALMFYIVLVSAVLTYFIPAGEFDRVEDPVSERMIVKEGSFHEVEKAPVSILKIPSLIIAGLSASSGIILFIFVVGGSFKIITSTGAFDAVIRSITTKLGKREILIIPLLLITFSVFGATVGMSIEALGLVPLVVTLARSLKYDALTGMAIVLVGVFCGFIAGLMNPFTVGVAQQIAGLPIYSGMWYRAIILVVLLIVASLYIIRYAKKVKANPLESLVYELEQQVIEDQSELMQSSKFQLKHFFSHSYIHFRDCNTHMGCFDKGLVY